MDANVQKESLKSHQLMNRMIFKTVRFIDYGLLLRNTLCVFVCMYYGLCIERKQKATNMHTHKILCMIELLIILKIFLFIFNYIT